MKPLPRVPVRTSVVPFTGGLDVTTPPLMANPGMCRDALNMVEDLLGGYARHQGYVRYDGSNAIRLAVWAPLPVLLSQPVAAGATITQGASSAHVLDIEEGPASAILILTDIAGEFVAGEFQAGGVTVGTALDQNQYLQPISLRNQNIYKTKAQDRARGRVLPPPGSGAVLGMAWFAGFLYAFRNSADGLQANLWRAEETGWEQVKLPVPLLPSGRYEIIAANFTGNPSTKKLYGCDGVNKAFSFDGANFVQISTGMALDNPQHICAHSGHLFLSFYGSLQNSALGDPTAWAPRLGAGEIGLGEQITNLKPVIGSDGTNALAVFTEHQSGILYGTSNADWQLIVYRDNAGAAPRSVQSIEQTWLIDNFGISDLSASQSFGNFGGNSASQRVNPQLIPKRNQVADTYISRENSRYCILFKDGTGFVCLVRGSKVVSIMPTKFPHEMRCALSVEAEDGSERIFFGGEDGYVYELGFGNSFDGDEIEWMLSMHFNHIKTPSTIKKFRMAEFEVFGSGYCEFNLGHTLGHGSDSLAQPYDQAQEADTAPLSWDVFFWDFFRWDGNNLVPMRYALYGNATNISFIFQGKDNFCDSLRLSGATILYSFTKDKR